MIKGKLFLLPCYLGENTSIDLFSKQSIDLMKTLDYFVVENEKSARRFLKFIYPEIQQNRLSIEILDKNTDYKTLQDIAKPLLEGQNVGYLSEAGLPCIADPGAILVRYAHQYGVKVIPVSGPSSIILALISSGLNGQNFTFHGYLPIEKNERRMKIKAIEKESSLLGSAQIFMETPYRNHALLDELLSSSHSETWLCIASQITLEEEYIATKTISEWKKSLPDLQKKPTIFILQVDF